MTLRVLPPEVANRIAAGEVVERPASVVKELVENALDSGARRIVVELEDGGLKLIRVTDDGCGMSSDELALCILPHATSKISDVDDLFRVATYGFRGEALPSIGSVARLQITSRMTSSAVGSRIVVDAGVVSPPSDAGAPLGTSVEVRNLFFNVPARRKFLKSVRAESAAISELLLKMVLPDPGFSLELRSEDRLTLNFPAVRSRRERVVDAVGDADGSRLLDVECERGTSRLQAFVSPVDLVKATARSQHIFVNGRWIKDRKLSFAIVEAYRGLIMPKDHPIAFIFLSVDPAEVDVNVHPTKSEVRFRDPDSLFSLIVRGVRSRLEAAPGAHRLNVPNVMPFDSVRPRDSAVSRDARRAPVLGSVPPLNLGVLPWDMPEGGVFTKQVLESSASDAQATRDSVAPPDVPQSGLFLGNAPAIRFLQVHRSYVVVETVRGIRILDQHALHERKLFDELMGRLSTRDVEDQLLLVPEVVELGPIDLATILDHAESLSSVGLSVEPFGSVAIALRSVPLPLRNVAPRRVFEAVIETLRAGHRAPSRDELIRDVIANLACRSAVKFGDSLPEPLIETLVRYELEHPEARNCPHGRNVALEVSLADLELRFQRKK